MRNIISAAERRQCAKTPQVRCPVRIFHGAQDGVVPPFVAQEVVNWLESRDVHLTMIQGGDHRLSRPEDLRSLVGTCRCRSLPAAHAHAHAHTRTHAHMHARRLVHGAGHDFVFVCLLISRYSSELISFQGRMDWEVNLDRCFHAEYCRNAACSHRSHVDCR